jgi:hypothetical protein
MVFPNEELMKRDKADSETLVLYATEGDIDMVEYKVGIDFKPTDNSLVVVDEADFFIFADPIKFKQFM